jgi:hypothetical protein
VGKEASGSSSLIQSAENSNDVKKAYLPNWKRKKIYEERKIGVVRLGSSIEGFPVE